MIYLHAAEPPSGRPEIATIARDRLYGACWRGDEPAELLDTEDREHLIHDLWLQGWTAVQIATHTRLSTYTVARIRGRLGLAAAVSGPRVSAA